MIKACGHSELVDVFAANIMLKQLKECMQGEALGQFICTQVET